MKMLFTKTNNIIVLIVVSIGLLVLSSSFVSSENNDSERLGYDIAILCSEIGDFLVTNEDYTYEDKQNLRNELSEIFGFEIRDELLNKYLVDFDSQCEEFKVDDIPDSQMSEENIKATWIVVLFLTTVGLILVLYVIYHNEKLKVMAIKIKKMGVK